MDDLQLACYWSNGFERTLRSELRVRGSGLGELVRNTRDALPPPIRENLATIARIRNKVVHDEVPLADRGGFERLCHDTERALAKWLENAHGGGKRHVRRVSEEVRRHPILVVVPPRKEQSIYRLKTTGVMIGRQPNTFGGEYIRLRDDFASREHARIYFIASRGYILRDLDSTNGTFVDGLRLTGDHVLAVGNELRIGHTLLYFELDADPKNA
jgi:hypothetical protein